MGWVPGHLLSPSSCNAILPKLSSNPSVRLWCSLVSYNALVLGFQVLGLGLGNYHLSSHGQVKLGQPQVRSSVIWTLRPSGKSAA